jgi:hypothetical protein
MADGSKYFEKPEKKNTTLLPVLGKKFYPYPTFGTNAFDVPFAAPKGVEVGSTPNCIKSSSIFPAKIDDWEAVYLPCQRKEACPPGFEPYPGGCIQVGIYIHRYATCEKGNGGHHMASRQTS